MDPVVHFEMPYKDGARMAKFYRSAFGWQTRMLGEEMGNYVLATTVETDEKGPVRPGAINGGFYPRKRGWPAQYPSVVIAVKDIKKAVEGH
jgi:predicted enzyme related to lactoylglutathione lyase